MKGITLILLWLVFIIIDGVVLPAALSMPAGFGIIVLLIALSLSFSIHRWVVISGLCLAFITEIILGLYFGSLMGEWLAIAWVWYGLNDFFNLKSFHESGWSILAPFAIIGTILFTIAKVFEWVIIHLAYDRTLAFSATQQIIKSPVILAMVFFEMCVLLFIFHLIHAKRISY